MEIPRCARCGTAMGPTAAVQGLCPGCLLRAAMSEEPLEEAPPLDDPGEWPPPPYRVLTVLGQGRRGMTFLARDTSTPATLVALKLLAGHPDPHAAVGRFEAMRTRLSMLRHPNSNRTLDVGLAGPHSVYLVTDFVPGVPLAALLGTPLAQEERDVLGGQLRDVVLAAHRLGILHLNLSAATVRVTRVEGRRSAKVLEFGLAAVLDETQGSEADDQRALERLLQILRGR